MEMTQVLEYLKGSIARHGRYGRHEKHPLMVLDTPAKCSSGNLE